MDPEGIFKQIQPHGQELAFNMAGPISRQANGSRVLLGAYAGLQGFVGAYTKITKGALEKYNNIKDEA